jgi:hypothetical protein
VVLDKIVQGGVAGGRALQAQAHQELVQRHVDAMIILGGGSAMRVKEERRRGARARTLCSR